VPKEKGEAQQRYFHISCGHAYMIFPFHILLFLFNTFVKP